MAPKNPTGFAPKNQSTLDAYIAWFTTPISDRMEDERTATQITDKLGISRLTSYKWQKTPYFKEQITKISEVARISNTHRVKQALLEKALEGDVPAAKLYKDWIEGITDKLDINSKVEGKVDVTFDLSDYLAAKRTKDK